MWILIKGTIRKVWLFRVIFQYAKYYLGRYLMKKSFKNVYLYKSHLNIKTIEKFQSEVSFFGYYNLSPTNRKNNMLFTQTASKEKNGTKKESLKIMLIKDFGKTVIHLTNSRAWNWQQACMLQWFMESDDKIIFNNYSEKEDSYFSEILNVESKESKKLCMPVYAVANNGKFALTLNFERLAKIRPDYGYFSKESFETKSLENDGIWRIDITRNKSDLIISLKELIKFKPDATMKNAEHWVNHIDIAPNGLRFMFLHRWQREGKRYMRLLTANCDGSNLHYVTGNVMVSHNCWGHNNEIISFCQTVSGKNRYVRFKDLSEDFDVIGEPMLTKDGHPSISPDGQWMLTDDYPDNSRFSHLYLYNLINSKCYVLGKFHQPLKYNGEYRIDLHPKWSVDGTKIFFDSGHNGLRKMYVIDITRFLHYEKEETTNY